MAYAKLANAAPAANTLTTIYTVEALKTVKGNLVICNPGTMSTTVDVAISALATPTGAEYIAKGLIIEAGDTKVLSDLFLTAAELVVVKSAIAGVSYRLHGDLV